MVTTTTSTRSTSGRGEHSTEETTDNSKTQPLSCSSTPSISVRSPDSEDDVFLFSNRGKGVGVNEQLHEMALIEPKETNSEPRKHQTIKKHTRFKLSVVAEPFDSPFRSNNADTTADTALIGMNNAPDTRQNAFPAPTDIPLRKTAVVRNKPHKNENEVLIMDPNKSEIHEFEQDAKPNSSAVNLNEVMGYFKGKYQTNRSQIRLNCFLFVLLGIILTAILIFVAYNPDSGDIYQFLVTPYCSFWLSQRRLRLFHESKPHISPLDIYWGFHTPPSTHILPSYCSRQETKCAEGHCCLLFPDHSTLRLSSFHSHSLDCVQINWSKAESEIIRWNDHVDLSDCIELGTNHLWYGGALAYDTVSWPRIFKTRPMKSLVTGESDPTAENGTDFFEVVEPFWVSQTGYLFWVRSTGLVFLSSTNKQLCVQSRDNLTYTVCKGNDLRDLGMFLKGKTVTLSGENDTLPSVVPLELQSQADFDSNSSLGGVNQSTTFGSEQLLINQNMANIDVSDSQHPTESASEMNGLGKILIGINPAALCRQNDSQIRNFSKKLKEVWNYIDPEFKLNPVLNLKDLGMFNATESAECSIAIQRLKTEVPQLSVGGEVCNFILPRAVEEEPSLRSAVVWLKRNDAGHEATMVVLWEGRLLNLVDFTREKVREWFRSYILTQWSLYPHLDYITGYGGAGSLIPSSSDLNVTSDNPNYYSKLFVESLNSIPKTMTVPVAFLSSHIPVFLTLPISVSNPSAIIPTALSVSLLGYSRLTLDIGELELGSSIPDERSLVILFRLAMFFPSFRVPYQFFSNDAIVRVFNNTVKDLGKIRIETILPLYEDALRVYAETGIPVIRPMWWSEECASVQEEESISRNISNQFLIGNDVIIAVRSLQKPYRNKLFLLSGTWEECGNTKPNNVVYVAKPEYAIYLFTSEVACLVRVQAD